MTKLLRHFCCYNILDLFIDNNLIYYYTLNLALLKSKCILYAFHKDCSIFIASGAGAVFKMQGSKNFKIR